MKRLVSASLIALTLTAPALALPMTPSASAAQSVQLVTPVRADHGRHEGWGQGRHYGWRRSHHRHHRF